MYQIEGSTIKKAMICYETASKGGDPDALTDLAYIYENGMANSV